MSSIFCALLIDSVMKAGVATDISFIEFLSSPENVIFCLLMSSLALASWLMKGANNQVIVAFWALGLCINYALYELFFHHFYFAEKNVYALNFIGCISAIPLLMLVRYRIDISRVVLVPLLRFKPLAADIDYYLSRAKITDFDFLMRWALSFGFCIEFTYSLYLSVYSLFNRIPFEGSVWQSIENNGSWDPFHTYYWLLNVTSIIYIFIVFFHSWRCIKIPDAFAFGASNADKRKIVNEMLLEKRTKADEKSNKET